jgi:hypothetical protein
MKSRGSSVGHVTVVVLLSLLLGMTVMVHQAFAGGSPPTETASSVDLPANFFKLGACDFPIRIEATGLAGTIQLRNNRFIFTSPGLDAVVTNLDDPARTVTLNVTGVFHQTTESNGDVVDWRIGLINNPAFSVALACHRFERLPRTARRATSTRFL